MSDPVPAVPHRFRFELRLVDERCRDAELDVAAGLTASSPNPFANRDYVLVWGNVRLPGRTDAEGLVQQDVDGTATSGELQLGRIDDKKFYVELTIPVSHRPPQASTEDNRLEVLRDEITVRMLNLGMIESEDGSAFTEGLRRYTFRRRFVGSRASLDRANEDFPTWDAPGDVAKSAEKLELVLRDLRAIHDRRGHDR